MTTPAIGAPSTSPVGQTYANKPPVTPQAAGPTPDGAALNERQVGPPKPGQMQGLMQDHAEKDALVNDMLMTSGPGQPSEQEAAQIRGALGAVDTNVLRFTKDSELKIGVLGAGEEMFETGVLRPQDAQAIERKGPQMQAFTQQMNADLDKKYAESLQSARDELAALPPPPPFAGFGGFGGGTPDPDMAKRGELSKRVDALELQKAKDVNAAVEKSGLPIKQYTPRFVNDGTGGMGAAHINMMMAKMPVTTSQMAAAHGATTPEQQEQFTGLVEQINGPRLQEARADYTRHISDAAARAATPEEKAHWQGLMEKVQQNPRDIPVDFNKYNIMVPDMHYGKNAVLDTHDTNTLRDWAGEGTTTLKAWDPETRTGSATDGQYFHKGGLNAMVVRDTAVQSASVHELGHAVDFQMEKKDPQFYAGWKPRLEAAHEKASEFMKGKTVSEYAKTNPREYIAEGVAHYYEDPKGLKAADPELFALTEELLGRAGQLGARK